jgi:hypothetical protein
MSDEYVSIFRCSNTVQTNLIENILVNQGIAVRVLGTRRGGSVGMGQSICSCRFEVPPDDVERSRELLEHLVAGDYALEEGALCEDVEEETEAEEPAGAAV